MTSPRIVITCVHGSFARGSRWTMLESSLQRTLPIAQVHYYEWSGRNRFRDRVVAAQGLRRWIESVGGKYPDATHFLVAHSHGGNVVLQALAEANVRERVGGVVCLSTPFISTRIRRIPPLVAALAVIGQALALSTLLWVTTHQLWEFTWLPSIALSSVPLVWVSRKTISSLRQDLQDRFGGNHQLDLGDTPVFVVRSPTDEAYLALSIIQAIDSLLSIVIRAVLRLLHQLTGSSEITVLEAFREVLEFGHLDGSAHVKSAVGAALDRNDLQNDHCIQWLLAMAAVLPMLLWVGSSWGPWQWDWDIRPVFKVPVAVWAVLWMFGTVIMLFLTLGLLCSIAVMAAVSPLWVINALLYTAYGVPVSFWTGLFACVNIEAVPQGLSTCYQLSSRERPPEKLFHSLSYADSAAIGQIEQWIEGRLALRVIEGV